MYLFGIDIGGTSIKIGCFDGEGNLLEQWEIPTHPNQLFNELSSSIQFYMNKKNITRNEIFGFGIGLPGIVRNGIALSCVNLGWEQTDVQKEFSKALGFDANVYIFNDANLAALGEASYLNKEKDSVVFITLGTGVGGGILMHGEIVEGTSGLGGEIGHMPIDNTYQFVCGCGGIGHLETLASATGIVRLARFYQDKLPTCLTFEDTLTAKDVIDAAKQQDPLSNYVLDEACLALAKAMASITVIINPSGFIIGGGLSNAGEFLLNKIKTKFQEVCLKQTKTIDIHLAVLKNNAGIYGACAYLIKKKHEVEKNGKC